MYEMGVPPERVAKLSGIGCSSKSPAYFMNRSHSFNAVHGRMPSVATGAMLANRNLIALGVSGDGDTASIGVGQFVHLMRRNLPIIYIIEDNGVYGLTKGQFSATADLGSTLKTGVINDLPPIDTCAMAITLGATFVGRSFSGDKRQLHSHAEGGHRAQRHGHARRSFALRDLQRPRGLDQVLQVHEGPRGAAAGSQLRARVRGHQRRLRSRHHDRCDHARRIAACACASSKKNTTRPTGSKPLRRLKEAHEKGEVLTGVFYVNAKAPTFVDLLNMTEEPLATLPESAVRPGRDVLEQVMEELR